MCTGFKEVLYIRKRGNTYFPPIPIGSTSEGNSFYADLGIPENGVKVLKETRNLYIMLVHCQINNTIQYNIWRDTRISSKV